MILTLSMEEQSQGFFNALRKLHFPKQRNYLRSNIHSLAAPLPLPARPMRIRLSSALQISTRESSRSTQPIFLNAYRVELQLNIHISGFCIGL